MKTISTALVSAGLLCAGVAQAQTTYDLSPGLPVNGSITLLSGVSGPIVANDVVSFDFNSFPGLAIAGSVLGTSAACSSLFSAGCGLTVSGNELLWTGTIVGSDEPPWYGITFANAERSAKNPEPNFTITTAPLQGGPANYEVGSEFLLASDSAAPAPEIEPSGAIAALTLLAGFAGLVRGRKRA